MSTDMSRKTVGEEDVFWKGKESSLKLTSLDMKKFVSY